MGFAAHTFFILGSQGESQWHPVVLEENYSGDCPGREAGGLLKAMEELSPEFNCIYLLPALASSQSLTFSQVTKSPLLRDFLQKQPWDLVKILYGR